MGSKKWQDFTAATRQGADIQGAITNGRRTVKMS